MKRVAPPGVERSRWRDLDRLLLRSGNLVGPGFEPGEEVKEILHDMLHVLVIGAGGLGCELLKDLALTGFKKIDVIDMDTIDVSNLNRQFLFRMKDVGKSKATVAAERVMQRVHGVSVTPHFCRIEDKPPEFYQAFHIIVLGLDSVEARSWINGVVCGFLEYEDDGSVKQETIKPMVDGGTEGFKGHSRVIIPSVTPCFQCTMWLFPPQTKFPLCTLAETPRSAAHCIEWAHLIQWGQVRGAEVFDADVPEHMKWIYEQAVARAELFNIPGVTLQHTQGVVKNIIPAIPSTNAIVAASCALETLKMATMCSTGMSNYMMYMGAAGIYTHTVAYEKDPECIVCSAGVPVAIEESTTLEELMQQLCAQFPEKLATPSVSFQGCNLYMRGIFEEETRPNLAKRIIDLMEGATSGVLIVNDKKLHGPLRIQLSINAAQAMQT
ncbi:NEDD8-activating enzyme E1 catalytic subunit [Cymbomonas tetramitiformis]|uniref:NEDD8-activating enzyme E1 catalytic subunit n=1 Tax=Cymbomonas tetramitiformis TaxID=36881 RepID=A0AAE0LHC7_9CHLO|nr:NEDD8-activating enzyme E1 catalytic subunit [Cymbomonas tetramitiformis]